MSKKGDNIYRRKDGRWEGRYAKGHTDEGKLVYGYVYAKTYHEVRSKLRTACSDGAIPSVPTTEISNPVLFSSIALDWLQAVKPTVKESTYVKYHNLIKTYVNPHIGMIPLCKLTNADIENNCSVLLHSGGTQGNGLTAKTVSSVVAIIRAIIKYGALHGNSVQCDTNSIRIHQETKEMRIFTDSEQEKLCTFLCSDPNPVNLGILLCLFTGLRIGEICALRWEDISIQDNTVHIHQTMQRIQDTDSKDSKTKVIITTPKSTCSTRTIPIPSDVVKAILSQGKHDNGFFLTNSEKHFLEPRVMQYRFANILKACEIAPANYHALRHTFATKCVELGFDVKTLSEILGHASVNITMNRYVHPTMSMKQAHMQRLSVPIAVKK